MPTAAADHPFLTRPHRTLLALSFPVLLSLVAEPLTGLADTAFVARLGSAPLAALGVATILLSSVFWIFNFLGIGTQTEVARAFGAGRRDDARQITSLALVLSLLCGALLVAVGEVLLRPVVVWMGARDAVHDSEPSPWFVISTVSSSISVLPAAAESLTSPIEALSVPIGGGVTNSSSLQFKIDTDARRTTRRVLNCLKLGPARARTEIRRTFSTFNTYRLSLAA